MRNDTARERRNDISLVMSERNDLRNNQKLANFSGPGTLDKINRPRYPSALFDSGNCDSHDLSNNNYTGTDDNTRYFNKLENELAAIKRILLLQQAGELRSQRITDGEAVNGKILGDVKIVTDERSIANNELNATQSQVKYVRQKIKSETTDNRLHQPRSQQQQNCRQKIKQVGRRNEAAQVSSKSRRSWREQKRAMEKLVCMDGSMVVCFLCLHFVVFLMINMLCFLFVCD